MKTIKGIISIGLSVLIWIGLRNAFTWAVPNNPHGFWWFLTSAAGIVIVGALLIVGIVSIGSEW